MSTSTHSVQNMRAPLWGALSAQEDIQQKDGVHKINTFDVVLVTNYDQTDDSTGACK